MLNQSINLYSFPHEWRPNRDEVVHLFRLANLADVTRNIMCVRQVHIQYCSLIVSQWSELQSGNVVKLKLLNILLSDMRIFRSFNHVPGYRVWEARTLYGKHVSWHRMYTKWGCYLGNGSVEIKANQRGDVGWRNGRRVSGDNGGVCIARTWHDQHLNHRTHISISLPIITDDILLLGRVSPTSIKLEPSSNLTLTLV